MLESQSEVPRIHPSKNVYIFKSKLTRPSTKLATHHSYPEYTDLNTFCKQFRKVHNNHNLNSFRHTHISGNITSCWQMLVVLAIVDNSSGTTIYSEFA